MNLTFNFIKSVSNIYDEMIENGFSLVYLGEFSHAKKADWFFGYLSYNLKNQFFPLTTNHINESGFADFFFFQPETVFLIKNNIIEIHSLLPKDKLDWLVEEITNTNNIRKNEDAISERPIAIVPIISKNEYLEKVNILKKHIQRGDIYEVNFCQEFRQENVHINPLELFIKLKTTSPTPFSAWTLRLHSTKTKMR